METRSRPQPDHRLPTHAADAISNGRIPPPPGRRQRLPVTMPNRRVVWPKKSHRPQHPRNP